MVVRALHRLGLSPGTAGHQRGRGALIGIVDTGIDLTGLPWHDQVIEVGDQHEDLSVESVEPWSMTDPRNHGTLVARIAHTVAPDAGLIVVRSRPHNGGILEATKWLVRRAAHHEMPIAINISQGGNHADPHDGRDNVSLGLDDLAAPGVVVCAAAGNDGPAPLHISGPVSRSQALVSTFWVQPFQQAERHALDRTGEHARAQRLQGYLAGPGDLIVQLQSYDDSFPYPLIVESGQPSANLIAGDCMVSIAVGRTPSGDSMFAIRVSDFVSWDRPADHGMFLELSVRCVDAGEPQRLDVWSEDWNAFFAAPVQATDGQLAPAAHLARHTMIASPAAASSAICVGAVCDRDRASRALYHRNHGQLADFSNQGPARDGRRRPDLVAAGEGLNVGGTEIDRGTSFSTPIVTGIAARMLAQNPTATPAQVRHLLTSTAVLPISVAGESDPDGYHPCVGFGEMCGEHLMQEGAFRW